MRPDTGKAWKTSHDFARFDAIMKQLADEHGFRHVPTHRYNPEATAHLPKKPNSRATYAAKRGANTARTQWSRETASTFGAELSERIDRSSSTDDIAAIVAEHGLQVEAKGKGFVVGNATSYAKLSALRLTTSARNAISRSYQTKQAPAPPAASTPAPAPSAGTRRIFDVDAIDIVRAFVSLGLADKTQLHAAIDEAATQRSDRLAKRPVLAQILNKLMATTAHTTAKPKPAKARQRRHISSGARSR